MKKKKRIPTKMKKTRIFLAVLALFAFVLSFSGTIFIKNAYDNHKRFLSLFLHNPTSILGTSTERINVSTNFSEQIATGSPLVFGGSSTGFRIEPAALDLMASVGVTSIRKDFWIETEVPSKVSLNDYKNNVKNVQDPKTWNWSTGWNNITIVDQALQETKKRGMKTIAILTYSPAWLTYSGTSQGVPRDWDVYRDIVKKIYKIHRPNIDIIEIWNEPTYTHFLDLKNSPYKTRGEAYRDIYTNAVRAINEVESEINDGKRPQVIAVVGHTPMDVSVLDAVLSAPESSSLVKAVSYHNYHIEEPSDTFYRSSLRKYGKTNIPIYLTEWNFSPDEKKTSPYHTTDLAIAYTGKKLIGFLNQGLAGANYFAMSLNDPANVGNLQSVFGFYRLDKNKKPYLLPQGKTWQLLSKSLGLGAGNSKIYSSSSPSPLAVVAFDNSNGKRGIALANDSNTDQDISITLKELNAANWDTISVYAASSKNDGKTPCVLDLIGSTSNQSLWISVPAQSVVGLTVTNTKLTPSVVLKKLSAPSASSTCAILK